MQLCEPRDVGALRCVARKGCRPVRVHGHARARCQHDAGAREPCTHAEVEPLVRTGKGGVGPKPITCPAADQDAADIRAERVFTPVVLTLVELACCQFDRATQRGHGDTERYELAFVVDVHELGRRERRGRRALQCPRELCEGLRVGCGVVGEQPYRGAFGHARPGEFHCLGVRGSAVRFDDAFHDSRDGVAGARTRSIARYDQCDRIGAAGLESQRVECPQQLCMRG